MDHYRVDTAEVAALVDKVAKVDKILEERLSAVAERIDALHVQWTGKAAEAHRAAHQQWLAGAQQMRAALATLGADTQHAHDSYQAAGRTSLDMWPR